MIQHIRDHQGKKLRNLDDPDLTLPGDDQAADSHLDDQQLLAVVEGFKQVLGERVNGVQASNVLRNHPIRLVATGNSEMERMRRLMDRDTSQPTRKIEFNQSHPIIVGVAQRLATDPNDPVAAAVVEQLYASALLLEGIATDPATLVKRMEQIMQAAVR
jgi:molecular chaperone HtpG